MAIIAVQGRRPSSSMRTRRSASRSRKQLRTIKFSSDNRIVRQSHWRHRRSERRGIRDSPTPMFPTVDPSRPLQAHVLAKQAVMDLACVSSLHGLREAPAPHAVSCLKAGSLYTIDNGNLLFHACVPLERQTVQLERGRRVRHEATRAARSIDEMRASACAIAFYSRRP